MIRPVLSSRAASRRVPWPAYPSPPWTTSTSTGRPRPTAPLPTAEWSRSATRTTGESVGLTQTLAGQGVSPRNRTGCIRSPEQPHTVAFGPTRVASVRVMIIDTRPGRRTPIEDPRTNVAQVDVDGQDLCLVLRRLCDDVAPRVDDVGTAPEVELPLDTDAVDEHHEELEHPAVEPGDVVPVLVRVVPVGKDALRARGRHQQQLGAALGRQERQLGLPRVVAAQHRHPGVRPCVERAKSGTRGEMVALLER